MPALVDFVRRRPLVTAGLGVGAVGLVLAFLFRKPVAKGVRTVASTITSAASLIAAVTSSAASAVTGAAYRLLPSAPIPEPAVDKSLASLTPAYAAQVPLLQADLNAALGAVGHKAVLAETRRSTLRQAWLWGIGRLWQAPGRAGKVTNIKLTSNHAGGTAVDFTYVSTVKGAQADEKKWLPVLQRVAPSLESRYGLKWGGHFKGEFKDWPHWEVA